MSTSQEPLKIPPPSSEKNNSAVYSCRDRDNSLRYQIFKKYFLGWQDISAEQLPKGDYRRINRSISNKNIEDHLLGKKTYATYPVSPKTKVSRHTVIYITHGEISFLNRLMDGASDAGLYSNQMIPEYTGGLGYHLWLRHLNPIDVGTASVIGELILRFSKVEGEVFPSQDIRDENIINLPLGIDQKYRQKSYLFDAKLNPIEDWAAYLPTIKAITPQEANYIIKAY